MINLAHFIENKFRNINQVFGRFLKKRRQGPTHRGSGRDALHLSIEFANVD